MGNLIARAERLESEGIFLGGPASLFETAGQKLLITLLSSGLTPDSKVLDIGCGCLRGGYWLIHFLNSGSYFGIEPNKVMLDAGIRILLEPGLAELKRPQFDDNAEFDLAVFKERFDFCVARSIWTHASKDQIRTMLDGFVSTSSTDGIFLASYKRARLFKPDYTGTQWVGRSHETDVAGAVRHSLRWIHAECAERGLVAEPIKGKAYNFGDQTWLRIKYK